MQTYRNPRWSLVILVMLWSFMALIGVSIAVHPGNAGHAGTAPGYIAFGSLIATACVLAAVGQLASRLTATEQRLTWRFYLRTRSIAWTDVQDVLVVPAKSVARYFSPGVKPEGRLIRIDSVIGPCRYTESVVVAIHQAQIRARATVSPCRKPAAPPAT